MSRNDDFNLIDLTENLEKSTEELIREVKTESKAGKSEINMDMYQGSRSRQLNTDMYQESQGRQLNTDMYRESRELNTDMYGNREHHSERYASVEQEPHRERSSMNQGEVQRESKGESSPQRKRQPVTKQKQQQEGREAARQKYQQEERRRNSPKTAGDDEMSERRKGKRKPSKAEKKLKRRIIKILLVIAILFGLVYGAVYAMVGKVEYETMATDYVRPDDVETVSGVKNILLIGTDARSSDEDGRSDSMIVLSINSKKNRIVMTSILRDSYVEIPGHGSNRINAAYSYGQEDLLIQTIEQNFKIPIDAYVKVDFFSFIDIVDAVGGVEIDVSEEEMKWVNAYLNETNELLGAEFGDGYLTSAGTQTLTGKQALSYARIRYIGTDFQRTERQREIITAVMSKAKTMGPAAITKLMDSILPNVKTNMKHSELTLLAMKSVLYMGYDMQQIHLPADGTWKNATISGMSVLQLDFDANIAAFKEAVYGDGVKESEE